MLNVPFFHLLLFVLCVLCFTHVHAQNNDKDIRFENLQKEYYAGESTRLDFVISNTKQKTFQIVLLLNLPSKLTPVDTTNFISNNGPRFISYTFNDTLPAPYNYTLALQHAPKVYDTWDFLLLPVKNESATSTMTSTTSSATFQPVTPTSEATTTAAPVESPKNIQGIKHTAVAALAVGCVAVLAFTAAILLLIFCLRRRRRTARTSMYRRPSSAFLSSITNKHFSRRRSKVKVYKESTPPIFPDDTTPTVFADTLPPPLSAYIPPVADKSDPLLQSGEWPPYHQDEQLLTVLPAFQTPPMSPREPLPWNHNRSLSWSKTKDFPKWGKTLMDLGRANEPYTPRSDAPKRKGFSMPSPRWKR